MTFMMKHSARDGKKRPDSQTGRGQPLVSVITAAWNSEKYIAEAIESVQAQTYDNWELIVVDDACTDGTPQIVSEYAARDERVRLLRNREQQGPSPARNTAMRGSRGEFIAVLDSDDIALPRRLERTVPILQKNPEVAVVGGPAIMITEQGEEIGPMGLEVCGECDMSPRAHLAHGGNCFVHSSVLMRRAALLEVGAYDEWFKCAQDYDLWLRLSERYELLRIDEPLVEFRQSLGGISAKKSRLQDAYAAVAYQRWLWKQRGRTVDLEGTLQSALRSRRGGQDMSVGESLYAVGWKCAEHGRFSLARAYFLRSFLARPQRPRALFRAVLTLVPGRGKFAVNLWRRCRVTGRRSDGDELPPHDRRVDPVFAE